MDFSVPHRILDDVHVLDFTQVIAGPYCTRLLADLGARVTKIDRLPSTSPMRSNGSPTNNVGKRSLALDLKSDQGVAIARALAERVDVVVENFSPGVMDRLGLGYGDLASNNPGLIYASISGFGHGNSFSHRRAYGATAHAEAGLLWVLQQAHGDDGIRAPGLQIADVVTGMNAFSGILAALHDRTRTGRGQHLDVSLMESQLAFLGEAAAQALTGVSEEDWDPFRHPIHKAKDGREFTINIGGPRNWHRLLEGLGAERTEFPADASAANDAIGRLVAERTSDELIAGLERSGAPYGLVMSMPEAIRHPYVQEQGSIVTVDDPIDGAFTVLRPPLRFGGVTPTPVGSPPLAGEHSAAILQEELGYDESALLELARTGVIGMQDGPSRE